MLSSLVADRVRSRVQQIGALVARTGLTPNQLTMLGLVLNAIAGLVLALGYLQVAGVLLLVAGAFDLLDGAVARATGNVTRFGGVLDSVLDRYSEAFVVGGLLFWIVRADLGVVPVVLCYWSIVGSLLVSYVRARAEGAGIPLTQGFFARPERIVVLAVGLLLARPVIVLWLLAIATNLTVLQRLWLVRHAARD
ncbi:CDP-alcohol phosphatidyltransferase family protein [Thermomicrobium sp. 4228-Ro]|uniref:CDP-alcohol phosphatidyltransferase family protein n=1 Tax=Thermomicrobium sp. 4228-Ro TaxID=2993937 RepID=UPI0022497DD6|nr:CDP-alcohol phosphatidyltransferase family protein [Thermomicrobium sp. 4228-Ro]MCX2727247.1 CDP-alcohol phosphatidyltransferase family protein [Thermomicrobium sp. 4228-Ro]